MAALKQPEARRAGCGRDQARLPDARRAGPVKEPASERDGLQSSLGNRGVGIALQGGRVTEPVSSPTSWYLAEDAAMELKPGQIRRGDFLRTLERVVYHTAEQGLAPLGRTARDCPYLRAVFRFYGRGDAARLSEAMRGYAPETAWAGSAAESAWMVGRRVRDSVSVWASTGRLAGVPQWREEPGGAVAAQIRGGLGEPLPGSVRGRMETAFGETFEGVRVHTDGPAGEFAEQQRARAVTVGQDLYFARNQFRPGTLAGDAILAHELAHVVQQRGGGSTEGEIVDRGGSREYERDADQAAGTAVHSIWTKSLGATAQVLRRASVSMRTGLSVQRCGKSSKAPPAATQSTSLVAHTSSNYRPSGAGNLEFGQDPTPGPVPGMAVEIPDYLNEVDVATSGGSDTAATDYQAGYVQTLLSSWISFDFRVAPNTHAFFMQDRPLGALRDGVAGTTAPWYDMANSTKTFPAANSSMHLAMRDTPGKTMIWGNTTSQGVSYFLAESKGKDEFCTWLAVQQVSTGKMTYLNHNTWNVDWGATYDAGARTGTQTGTGGTLDQPPGTGQGPKTPVEGGDLAKDEKNKPGNRLRMVR